MIWMTIFRSDQQKSRKSPQLALWAFFFPRYSLNRGKHVQSLETSVELIVDRLICNAGLPKYQLERASEPLLGLFIEQWLSNKLKSQLRTIAMEFPLKRPKNNQSTNVDYLLADDAGTWYFVEMKTSQVELDAGQIDAYVAAAKKVGAALKADIEKISERTRAKPKYTTLLSALEKPAQKIEVVFITPHERMPQRLVDVQFRWFPLKDLFSFEPPEHRELWRIVRKLEKVLS